MKNTTQFFLIVLLAFFGINANGQTFIVKGGVNLSKISTKDDDYVANYHTPVGLNVGFNLVVAFEEAISDIFYVEAGPVLQMKGSKSIYRDDKTIHTIYLDMPIVLKGYFQLSEKILFYTTTGAYLGIAVFGNVKDDFYSQDIPWEENDNYGLNRLDFGLSLGGGFDYKSMQIGFAYDFSLLDISSYQYAEGKLKNNVMRFSLGYRFMKGKEKDGNK